MGSFGGHVIPGSFFIIAGVWWTIASFIRYFRATHKGGSGFKSTATFPFGCCCGRLAHWEWEGSLKIFFTAVGFLVEVIFGYDKALGHVRPSPSQHATMYFFFGMSGVIDFLAHFRLPIPHGSQYVGLTLAFIVEGMLFKFHLHGRDEFDTLTHILLLYTIYASVISCLVEMRHPKSILSPLFRAWCVLQQGTWFWQVAFILYNPILGAKGWDHEDHDQMKFIAMIFAWHMGANMLIILGIGAIIRKVYEGRYPSGSSTYGRLRNRQVSDPLITQQENGHSKITVESDSDVEMPPTN